MDEFHVFTGPGGPEINKARQDHLATLNISIEGKRVLEVGAGIGLHSPFFIERGCDILITDGLKNNVDEAKRRLPDQKVMVLDLESDESLAHLGTFDIVYCYGLLYHLKNAESAIKRMSEVCTGQLLLETVVSGKHDESIEYLQDHGGNNGSIYGNACRPSRSWILSKLNQHFGYGYISKTQPNYPDFITDWRDSSVSGTIRSIFVGSKVQLKNKSLTTTPPMQQEKIS